MKWYDDNGGAGMSWNKWRVGGETEQRLQEMRLSWEGMI